MGFRIMWAQQQVIPWGNDSYLVTDNEKIRVDCDFDMTVTGLVIEGYNTDVFNHTIYLRGLIQTLTYAQEQAVSEALGSLALPASLVQTNTGVSEATLPPGIGVETQPSIEPVTSPSVGEISQPSSPATPVSTPTIPPITSKTPPPVKVEIPNTYGKSYAVASGTLKKLKFIVHTVPQKLEKGYMYTVKDSVPARGVKAIKGSTVTLHLTGKKIKPKAEHALVKVK